MPARLNINVFTPLPPTQSEIANVNAAVLRRLAMDADVTVWAPQEFWLPLDGEGLTVRPFRSDAIRYSDLHDADATFFNIGNNLDVHHDIYDVALRVPGVVVLHDLHLQHLMIAMHGQGCSHSYEEALERCHGVEAVATMRRAFADGQAGAVAPRFPMTLAAARMATGLVVHNPTVPDGLAAQSGLRVDYLPLPLAAGGGAPPIRREKRPPYQLIVFGFLGANRRIPAILDVLAQSPVRESFTLEIFGRYHDPEQLDALIAELGLGGRVTVHGFVPEERLDRAIAEADLALNLRYPSMGEASASQLRIWRNGTPSLVSRTQWYGTIPADCAHFIGVETETDDLHHTLVDFCCNPGRYHAAGANGWRHVRQHHSVARYAEGLLRIAARDKEGRRARLVANLGARLDLPPPRWETVRDALGIGDAAS